MNRNIKALGLAFAAVLALTAVSASAAQATFTSGASHTILHSDPDPSPGEFTFTAGTGIGAITCTVTFTGTQSSTSASTLTLQPQIGPTCRDSLGRVVHVTTNTLEYHLLTPHTKHVASGKFTGNAEVTNHIELVVTAPTPCTIKVTGAQTINNITYTNLGGTKGVTIQFHPNNTTSAISGGFFACGTSATHSNSGQFLGSIILTGADTKGFATSLNVD